MSRLISPKVSFVIPVYNSKDQALETVAALVCQEHMDMCEIILVEDGSKSPLCQQDIQPFGKSVKLIRHPINKGRAMACNSGIQASNGQFINFLDVDCVPTETYTQALFEVIKPDWDIVFGHLIFKCKDRFFQKFENSNQLDRVRCEPNWQLVQSSACLVIKADIVKKVQGFSADFNRYGFEDRDFLIRIKHAFPAIKYTYAKALSVTHEDDLQLNGYLAKFEASGRSSAGVLRRTHPLEYSQLAYAKVDVNTSSLFSKFPGWVLKPFIGILQLPLKLCFYLAPSWVNMRASIFKILKGLSYLKGTVIAKENDE
jgi:glycosyltransferase involved in cell wall biosynthesis